MWQLEKFQIITIFIKNILNFTRTSILYTALYLSMQPWSFKCYSLDICLQEVFLQEQDETSHGGLSGGTERTWIVWLQEAAALSGVLSSPRSALNVIYTSNINRNTVGVCNWQFHNRAQTPSVILTSDYNLLSPDLLIVNPTG